MQLKKRLDGGLSPGRRTIKPAFVELVAPHPAMLAECTIEFESSSGSKMQSSGRRPHRQIGQVCCAPGGKPKDDSDHRADARAGGNRAGRRKERHRLTGAALPGEA